MNETQNELLIFDPKPWTRATLKRWGITEDELAEREELEKNLAEKQLIWREKAFENLKADHALYQELLSKNEVRSYLRNAVKEATLEALSSILSRDTPEGAEKAIDRILLTPNDERTWLYGRMEEETESLYSFINLMRGRELTDDHYVGKVTHIEIKVVEDESDRNYGRSLFVVEIEIAEGFLTGKIVKIPFLIHPYFLDWRMAGEPEEQRQERIVEFHRERLTTFRNLGVVITDSSSAIISQIVRTVGNTVEFSIKRNGTRASIDKLIERVHTIDEMLSFDDVPDGNDAPLGSSIKVNVYIRNVED